ncbi:MAG: glycosyltransferase [Schleiferiaceae bacterium]|nr:glycosyltransferase [Schleiferiaceae bacterium]
MGIFVLLLAGIVGVQLLYHFVFMGFAFKKVKTTPPKATHPVSVVVCGRNEAANFSEIIPQLMEQTYPNFEVVAVNDQSIDTSEKVLEQLKYQYGDRLKVVNVQENDRFFNGKKFGLTLGIKAASHEHLIFTDADCRPATANWLQWMASGFGSHKPLVLGFGAYNRTRSFLNMIIRFETMQTAIQYFSWANVGLPYMGVGRNLGYHRKLFYEAKGFVKHMHLPYGDDDLFVNQVAHSKNTNIVFHKDSHTLSEPQENFKNWFFQKRRHLAAGKFYKKQHTFLLGCYAMTTLGFYAVLACGLVLSPQFWQELLVLAGLRYVFSYLVMALSGRHLGGYDLLLLLPVLELSLLVMTAAQHIANWLNGPPKRWKYKPYQTNSPEAMASV